MLALFFAQLVGEHAMVAAFHKLRDKCIMSDANVVICKIIAIYEGHNEDEYCAKLVVDRLVFTYIRQSQIFATFNEANLDRCHSATHRGIGIVAAGCLPAK